MSVPCFLTNTPDPNQATLKIGIVIAIAPIPCVSYSQYFGICIEDGLRRSYTPHLVQVISEVGELHLYRDLAGRKCGLDPAKSEKLFIVKRKLGLELEVYVEPSNRHEKLRKILFMRLIEMWKRYGG